MMRSISKFVSWGFFWVAAEYGMAQDRFNPTDFLMNREFETKSTLEQKIQEGLVVIKGIPYYEFKNRNGAIYLPKVTDLKEADFEKAICGNTSPLDGAKENRERKATVASAQKNLSAKTVVFAQLITSTIKKKCGAAELESGASIPLEQAFEVGVKVDTGTELRPSSIKIFNTNLLPNIGVRKDF